MFGTKPRTQKRAALMLGLYYMLMVGLLVGMSLLANVIEVAFGVAWMLAFMVTFVLGGTVLYTMYARRIVNWFYGKE